MATLPASPRIGSSQGASLFWGFISTVFAAAACFYFWRFHENESAANVLRDQVEALQERCDTLDSQREKMVLAMSEAAQELKNREDLIAHSSQRLNLAESKLVEQQRLAETKVALTQTEAAVQKKFDEAVRQLGDGDASADALVRRGRTVWRLPSSLFFNLGATSLKPGGRAALDQLSHALQGQMDAFELRIEVATDHELPLKGDGTAKSEPAPAFAPNPSSGAAPGLALMALSPWELTGERAGVITAYLRDLGLIPITNVVVIPRGDFEPVVPGGIESHARNRRLELSIAPLVPDYAVPVPDRPEKEKPPRTRHSAKNQVKADSSAPMSKPVPPAPPASGPTEKTAP